VIKAKYVNVPLFVLLSVVTGLVHAVNLSGPSDRYEEWEFYFKNQYTNSESIDFDGGAQASLNSSWNWGFGFGYNLDAHWALNFDFAWKDSGYAGTRIDDTGSPEKVSGRLYSNSFIMSGIYHFSEKRFTPFVGASFGWTYIDSNIPTGEPPKTVCWWDPWWGYVCDSYLPTRTSTEVNYGLTAGLRLEVKSNIYFKLSAARQWIDITSASSTPDFVIYRFDVGFMF